MKLETLRLLRANVVVSDVIPSFTSRAVQITNNEGEPVEFTKELRLVDAEGGVIVEVPFDAEGWRSFQRQVAGGIEVAQQMNGLPSLDDVLTASRGHR